MRLVAPLAIALALLPSIARAQRPLPPLPPPTSQPPPATPPQPPPPTPPPPPPPDATYDATQAPATVTTVPPPAYVVPPPPPDSGARTHDGFYLRMSTGLGGMSFSGSTPSGADSSLGGGALDLHLALGGTPSRGFVVGGAIFLEGTGRRTWDQAPLGASRNWSAGAIGVDALVDWFPNEHRGWHLGGKLGLAGVGIANVDDSNAGLAGGAVHGAAFGGYDFWVGSQWSLGVQGALDLLSRAKLQDQQSRDTGYTMGSFGAFLEFTALYH